jgi:hypothetical protein
MAVKVIFTFCKAGGDGPDCASFIIEQGVEFFDNGDGGKAIFTNADDCSCVNLRTVVTYEESHVFRTWGSIYECSKV